MATVRLRKAFRYPEDSDDEAGREELDEQGMFMYNQLGPREMH